MDNIFSSLGEETVETVETKTQEPAKGGKKQLVNKMKESLKETVLTDPTFKEKLRSLSESIEVVNSLGFGDSGNIIVDKSKPVEIDPETGKKKRPLLTTSQIVGYKVVNVGEEAIKYQTEVWTQGEDGKYVATKAEKTLAPGDSADLTRQYMTMLCAQPEISFQLANGKIIKGPGSKNNKGLKGELEAHYFRFDKDENGETKQINDDDVKLNVGEKVDDTWVVKPEYAETFGFLNNPKEGGKGRRKSSGEKFSSTDYAANYVNKLIQDAGL